MFTDAVSLVKEYFPRGVCTGQGTTDYGVSQPQHLAIVHTIMLLTYTATVLPHNNALPNTYTTGLFRVDG